MPSSQGGIPSPSQSPAEPASDITLLYLIKQVELAIRSHLDGVVRGEGLTVVQYTALTVLERRPGLTSAALAKNSFVRAQTMSQITVDLEDRGLISRAVDSANQRRLLLSVTQEGRAILDRLLILVKEIEARMVAELSADEARHLSDALHSCRIALGGTRPH